MEFIWGMILSSVSSLAVLPFGNCAFSSVEIKTLDIRYTHSVSLIASYSSEQSPQVILLLILIGMRYARKPSWCY